MNEPFRLDNSTARRLFLERHALTESPRRTPDRAALLALIERLGFVQIDSINTVARAHDMILFARAHGYRPRDLARLAERERLLFEHWTHDAAVIPMAFYPHWRRRFARDRERLIERWSHRRDFDTHFAPVLEHIRRDGPARAREVRGEDAATPSGGWWDWHPSKSALEYLWRSGDLAIAGRDSFQKIYDISERVIPEAVREVSHADAASIDWACRSALDRLGFATPGEIARFWDLVTIEEAKRWCDAERERRDGDRLVEVAVEPFGDGKPRIALARPAVLEALSELPSPPAGVRVLSPFDPLIRDRQRTERLFGFAYRIEVFVPEAKRRFGYYVFPLLEGDRLVGRIDMRRDSSRETLTVRRLWWEAGIRPSRRRLRSLEGQLDRLARFAGCASVRFEDGWMGPQ